MPARRPTRDIARRRPVLRACALAVPRLCAHCATRCPRMCGAPNRAHGRRATSRGVGPYADEPVCIPRFVYPERRARPSASAGAALPRRCAIDARHRAAKTRAEKHVFSHQRCGPRLCQRTRGVANSSRATSRGVGPHGKPDCFSYPECGLTFDLGADKNACWGDSTYHRRLHASGRKEQQTELALLLYSVSIPCKHLRSY